MPASLVLKLKGHQFNRPTLPVLSGTIRGFKDLKLAGLYMFEDLAPAVLVEDETGQANSATANAAQAGDAVAMLSGGGGIRLQGTSYVPGPLIDVTLPFAIFAGGSIDIPIASAGTYFSTLFSMVGFAVRGLIVYDSKAPPAPVTATQLALAIRPAQNGVQGGVITAVPANAGATYEDRRLFCLRHDGAGAFRFTTHGSGGVLQDVTAVIDTAKMTKDAGGVQVKTLRPTLGGINSIYRHANLAMEAFGAYTRTLPDAELLEIYGTVAALGAARGRAW